MPDTRHAAPGGGVVSGSKGRGRPCLQNPVSVLRDARGRGVIAAWLTVPVIDCALILELPTPSAIGGGGWVDFARGLQLHAENQALIYGRQDVGLTPEESWPRYAEPHASIRIFAVRNQDKIVARGYYDLERGAEPTAWLYVDVDPAWRHRGLGSAMAGRLHDIADADGVRKVIVYAPSTTGPGAQVTPTSGSGSLPAGNSEVRFLLGAGYQLEQVRRASALTLPKDASSLLAEASLAGGDNYRVHFWMNRTPDPWRSDMAILRQQMGRSAPTAGLDEPEEVWTVQRLIESEVRLSDGTRDFLTAAVEDRATRQLVGFTTLAVPTDKDRPVNQEDTLVLSGHRGHRLGKLLKVANLDHLQRERPGHPVVITFNAEENHHMLAVNDSLGFTSFGHEGAWRLGLT